MENELRLAVLIDADNAPRTALREIMALGDVQEAEDAVQDTFLRYLEKRPAFRDGEHERAWLLKVTANRCKSALRVWKRPGPPAQDGPDLFRGVALVIVQVNRRALAGGQGPDGLHQENGVLQPVG